MFDLKTITNLAAVLVNQYLSRVKNNTKICSTKILGLDICADTLVGDEMLKGISGGQKKRLTTGRCFAILLNESCNVNYVIMMMSTCML